MRTPTYPVLDVLTFSRNLVRTEDLDPVYSVLHRAAIREATLKRWLVAYWCYYHCGVASYAAGFQGRQFYDALRRAQQRKWPRGSERRHFRGKTEETALSFLECTFPVPEKAVDSIVAPTFQGVSQAIQQWPGYGPWIAFKAADMMERCLGVAVDFSDCELGFYKEPLAGAKMLDPLAPLSTVVGWVLDGLEGLPAPPRFDRPCNVQEAETCLCKYHSHCHGSYPPSKDKHEVQHALKKRWGPLAMKLRECLPQLGKQEISS